MMVWQRELGDVREESDERLKKLEKETKAHTKTTLAHQKLEALWKAEEQRRERVTKLEIAVTAATRQISQALSEMRAFLNKTDEHFKVDLNCLCCLQVAANPSASHPASPPPLPWGIGARDRP